MNSLSSVFSEAVTPVAIGAAVLIAGALLLSQPMILIPVVLITALAMGICTLSTNPDSSTTMRFTGLAPA